MSATQRLKDQTKGVTTAALSNVLDFDLRKQLKDALSQTGVYAEVNIKMDGRRGHLNLTVRGSYPARQQTAVIHYAQKANLNVALTLINQGPNQTLYRVTTLDNISKAQPAAKTTATKQAAKPAKATSTLGRAIQTEVKAQPAVQSVIAINGVNVGRVSPSTAKQIRQMVEAENKPKFAEIAVVDITTSKKVVINVPYDVAQAVKAQVPSFTHGDFVIKSTDGLTILKQTVPGNAAKTWVIA